MFEIGQKVICVDAAKQPHTVEELNQDVPNWVQKDKIYRIRNFASYDFVQAVYLEEIHNPVKYFRLINDFAEPGFATWRFRELAENEEFIEIKEEEYAGV